MHAIIEKGALKRLGKLLHPYTSAFILSDSAIFSLYGEQILGQLPCPG